MSSPWAAPEGDDGVPDGRALTSADVLLPLLAGGVLPAIINVCASCMCLNFVSMPLVALGAILGGALVGAHVSRRRTGPMGIGVAAGIGALFAAANVLPCTPFAAVLLVPSPDGKDSADALLPFLGMLVVVAMVLTASAGGSALLGHTVAQQGALGPAWTGRTNTNPSDSAPALAATWLALGTVAVFGISVAVCVGVIGGLTVLGSSLEDNFEKIEQEVAP